LTSQAEAPAQAVAPAPPEAPRTRWRLHLLVLLGFVALGLLQCAPLLAHPRSETLAGGSGDISIFLFFLSNTSHSLVHGHVGNVMAMHTLNAPLGVNSMWNTSLLLPAVVLTPVTALAGPLLSLNLIIVLGPALSAWSAYLCAGRFLRGVPARFVTGLLFGFSPGLLAANLGHFHLTLLMFVPPILLLTVDAVTRRRSPRRCGILIGLCVTSQVLIGEEVLALTGVTVAVVLTVLAAQRLRQVADHLRPLIVTTAWLLLTALITAGPFLAVQFFGAQSVSEAVSAPDKIVLDPTGLILPSPGVRSQVSFGLDDVLSTWHLGQSERMGYLGLPLVLLLAGLVVYRRRDLVARTAALSALVLGIFALGFTLHLNGDATGIPMPWKLTDGLPLLGNILPVRWMLMAQLMVALLVGLAIDAVGSFRATRRGQGAAWVVIALCLLPLVPHQSGEGQATHTPAWFTTTGQHRTAPVLVLPLPHPNYPQAMTWSAVAGTRFPIVGGYFIGPHEGGLGGFGPYPIRPTAHLLDLISITNAPVAVSHGVRLRAKADLAYWGTTTVVLGPCAREQLFLSFLTDLLGTPDLTGGVWVWNNANPFTRV
jgi:hypothetical protein